MAKVTMTKQVQDMIDILTASMDDATKADGGNAQAGKRLRASTKELLPIIKEIKKQSLGK